MPYEAYKVPDENLGEKCQIYVLRGSVVLVLPINQFSELVHKGRGM